MEHCFSSIMQSRDIDKLHITNREALLNEFILDYRKCYAKRPDKKIDGLGEITNSNDKTENRQRCLNQIGNNTARTRMSCDLETEKQFITFTNRENQFMTTTTSTTIYKHNLRFAAFRTVRQKFLAFIYDIFPFLILWEPVIQILY